MAETYARTPIWRRRASRRTGSIRAAGLPACLTSPSASHLRAALLLMACGLLLSFLPGFFNIPPVDRDEARFAQATKQMVESGDFVDIRFQDEVRYKKPVGIYWMQAAIVESASALGLQRAQVRIWLYRVPSLIGAIGAVLLTYWTALAFVTRRGAFLAALMMCSSILLGVEARLAKTDAMLLLTTTAVMGAMARAYLSWQRGDENPHPSWTWSGVHLLDSDGRRHPAQGAADPDVRRAYRRDADDPRSFCGVVVAAAAGLGPDVDSGAGAALVRSDFPQGGRHVLRGFARQRHADQGRERAGIPRRAAGTLFPAVLGDILAGRDTCGHGGARRSGGRGASRARSFCWHGCCRPGSCSNW